MPPEEQLPKVARRRRQQRRRQDPQGHGRLPEGPEQDHRGQGQLRRVRRPAIRRSGQGPFELTCLPSVDGPAGHHGRPCPPRYGDNHAAGSRRQRHLPDHRRQTVHALDRVSLDIPPDSIVVAVGASGCGKSTLLNAIAGFLPLTEGSITLDGTRSTARAEIAAWSSRRTRCCPGRRCSTMSRSA